MAALPISDDFSIYPFRTFAIPKHLIGGQHLSAHRHGGCTNYFTWIQISAFKRLEAKLFWITCGLDVYDCGAASIAAFNKLYFYLFAGRAN